MTSHPRDMNTKVIDVIKHSHKVCEHFHLPIQSGCDAILARMNRGYTTADYRRQQRYLTARRQNRQQKDIDEP